MADLGFLMGQPLQFRLRVHNLCVSSGFGSSCARHGKHKTEVFLTVKALDWSSLSSIFWMFCKGMSCYCKVLGSKEVTQPREQRHGHRRYRWYYWELSFVALAMRALSLALVLRILWFVYPCSIFEFIGFLVAVNRSTPQLHGFSNLGVWKIALPVSETKIPKPLFKMSTSPPPSILFTTQLHFLAPLTIFAFDAILPKFSKGKTRNPSNCFGLWRLWHKLYGIVVPIDSI